MSQNSPTYHLLWLYPGQLAYALDAATWLETTQELRELGWLVTLVAAGTPGQQFIRGVEVFCISRPEVYLLRQMLFHTRFIVFLMRHQLRFDVLLFHQMSAPWLLPVRLIRSLAGMRRPLLVMDIRSLHMVPENKQNLKDWLRGKFIKLMNRTASYWTDGYLTITQRMAEAIQIPPKKLWGTWPSGVNLNRFTPVQKMRQWPLSDEPIILIYLGTLHAERNLLTLSQAVEQVNKEGMAFNLWLVGEGTEQLDLEKLAFQTEGRICVIPPIPHENVPELLSRAHIGVLPFPDEEKFRVSSPIKLFEYMAAGLPILATRITCHTDVIGNGKYVFWAEKSDLSRLLDALRLVWSNRDALNEMGSQATVAAQAWTWNESAKKLKLSLEYGLVRYYSP